MEQQVKSCARCGEQNFLDAQFCLACGATLPAQTFIPPAQKKSSGLKIVTIIFGVMLSGCVIFGVLGALISANKTPRKDPSAFSSGAASTEPSVKPTPDNQLIVVKSDWTESGFGTIAIWKVTFKNNTDRPIGDIQYRTAYYSETGNLVDKGGVDSLLDKKTIQKVIPPKSTRTIEVNDGFTHKEAHRAGFEVVSWRFVSDSR